MRAIWKYPLALTGEYQLINMPMKSEFRHVAIQGDQVCIWVEVSDTESKHYIENEYIIVGTGHEIPKDALYRGTIHQGPMVWLVFER